MQNNFSFQDKMGNITLVCYTISVHRNGLNLLNLTPILMYKG